VKLIAYSKALYSTWIYYSPDRILFDAGEGASTILGNKSFAIEHVFLTHGHTDHVSGLLGLINIRNNAMGDTEKPLFVYYPEGNYRVAELMNYIRRTNRHLNYELEWIPLKDGDRVQVFSGQQNRYVEAFSTVHTQERSLGYNIIEERKRLKEEFKALSQEEIIKLVRQGKKEELTCTYMKKIFSYGGDSISLDPAKIFETEILCHDATFLKEEDRKEYKHATLEEALATSQQAKVEKELLAIHISSRYKYEIKEVEERVNREYGLSFKVTLVPPGKIFRRD